ncbi:LamG domain-containing protein [Variovorax boronicumulans]|uniref:LamG domain-containing protein n=1 Tax=Variovorax boronicumulans TaxID=436515 RepID=UPI0012E5E3E4|nr:LamG domain-containing protein [Variovorax boronicumulans]GER21447.1 hypothetical protein VCH24_64990 [Variovorax boronicumulans]
MTPAVLGAIAAKHRATGGGGGSDPDFASVTLLCHMDSAAGSALTDVKSHTLTLAGGAAIDNTNKKYGAGSVLFPNGGRVSVGASSDWSMTGDFTIEAWANWNSSPAGSDIFNLPGDWVVGRDSTGRLYLYHTAFHIQSAASSVALNAWYHVALTRSGTTMTLWLNGTSVGTYTFAGTVGSNSVWYIGAFDGAGSESMQGNIDDFRLTKGVARYTSAFTPPAAAFPNS